MFALPVHATHAMFMPHLVYAYPYPPPYAYRSLLFSRTPQGKVAELRLELQSSGGKKDKGHMTKRIALKKIVANMTMSNNDMVALFPDVIAVMSLQSLEIKKMWVECGLSQENRRADTDEGTGASYIWSTMRG